MGDVVTYVREIKNNVPIDDAKFKPKTAIDEKVKAAKK